MSLDTNIQGVSKLFGQNSRVSSSLTSKENIYINICQEVGDFELNLKIIFNNKYPNHVIFFLQLT
jgi:hypothetical protein